VNDVRLVGLDFGTTTSRCVAATARVSRNAITGRHELSDVREVFRSPVVLTPFAAEGLETRRLEGYLDAWLAAARADGAEIFGGGALVTGLAAQQSNSPTLIELIRSRVKDVLVAAADDPCLEAWLAFQANAGALSRAQPDRWVINLDIGGGTTNIALGRAGEVARTGSLFVGARHIEVVPGSYRIVRLSRYARAVLDHLVIAAEPGDTLDPQQVAAILDWQIALLESALAGDRTVFNAPTARLHEQVAFEPPADLADAGDLHSPLYCLSGGVGELVYEILRTNQLPPTTQFGDLGTDLAARLAASPPWAARLAARLVESSPEHAGRATVYGLLLYATQISGSTVYLPDPAVLPARDVPILGRVNSDSTVGEIGDILHLVRHSAVGGCVVVSLEQSDAATVRAVGERFAMAIRAAALPAATPLVLLARENVGKALGGYVSQWGATPLRLIVLDEIEPLEARYVQIGTLRDGVVPVSFYGMN
jgi:ethanolamine utilization protein EutA